MNRQTKEGQKEREYKQFSPEKFEGALSNTRGFPDGNLI